MGDVVNFKSVTTDEYFGGCPHCGQNNGFINVGRDHWFLCDRHKTKWWYGSNIFSCWRQEDEETWQRNRFKLAEYITVEPIFPEPTEEERCQPDLLEQMAAVDKGYGVISEPGKGMRALEPGEDPFEVLSKI